MTKHSIEVSKEVLDEYLRLKEEIKKMWWLDADDNQIVAAMIGWFFDSLEYMKNAKGHWHAHDHWHDHDWCCGWHADEEHECCGWKWDSCCS